MATYTIICQECSNPFILKCSPSQRKIRKYCSRDCQTKAKKKRIKRICKNCERKFEVRPCESSRQFCSHDCKTAFHHITIICKNCGQSFDIVKSLADRQFCSYSCSLEYRHSTGYFSPNLFEIVCAICGKTFSVQKHRKDEAQYCSKKCADEVQRTITGPEHPLYIDKVTRICDKCGKPFTVLPNSPKRFCSRKCAGIARTQIVVHCDNCGKQFTVTPAILKRKRRFCSRYCMLAYKGQTSIETLLAKELTDRNIPFESQYHIKSGNPKGWWIDFAFPAYKLAVEADGIYWHSFPNVQEKDARKDADLTQRGWTVLRFTGNEIRESPAACVDEIVKHLI